MEPIKEQFYLRRIAELEKEVAELRQQNAELRQQVAKLADQVARLSKNSSNSSKPPPPISSSRPRATTPAVLAARADSPDTKGSSARCFVPTKSIASKNFIQRPVHVAAMATLNRPAGSGFTRAPNYAKIRLRLPNIAFMDTCRKQSRSPRRFLQNALSAQYFQTPTPSLLPQAT